MSQNTWFIIAIVIYMLVMLAIGYWSYRQTDEYDDYMLAGRGLNPFVAALSAGASDMSGWLLMGLPGALFVSGMGELWIAIGLLIGCWANWMWVAPRLRSYTEIAGNSLTLPSFIENRLHDSSRALRVLSSIVILVFFTFYVSSGMVSGGRYFEATFGGSYIDGMLIVAAVTVAYTFIGGFLAVSYTDAVQGMLMFAALLIVPVMAYFALADTSTLFTWATDKPYGPWPEGNPEFFSMIKGMSAIGVISALAWGLGYFGQPHIVVRFMALRTPGEAKTGRRIGIFWMLLCIIGATAVAVIGTSFFGQDPSIAVTDQENFETIFLDMGRILFHPLIAGLILTAVLAAIMSTISSQLLVTSSALVEDIYMIVVKKKPSSQVLINLSRTAVVAVAVIAGLMAMNPSDSILGLVAFAWAGFGAAFGPLLIFALYWRRLNTAGAITGLVAGAVVAFAWGQGWLNPALEGMGLGALTDLYEIVPGVIAATLGIVVVSLATRKPDEAILEEFDQATMLARAVEKNPDMSVEDMAEEIIDAPEAR
ncbi:sodium/proline symporter PutP [Corynebacterium aquilae]|uniref:Sodium/proline symporter n=1 Tax=Corynebacterium aquilae DSM 44791 TaxID=1431546 RepID=A0A1L7CFB9_9CORY|nr:sodium/proline symporter PutP [Corynebacterium aquilae]APT84526.1 proline:sodium symporter PutP [Corynebacterium aquilae DSM 44791]